MKLKEHINISRRLIKLQYSLSRRHMWATIIRSVVTALKPYVPIYFSALLIDALVSGAPLGRLVLYASLTVGLSSAMLVIKHWLTVQVNTGESEGVRRNEWRYAEKAMEMAYSSIEDRDVSLLCERVKSETNTGYTLFYPIECITKAVSSIVSIAASLALTVSFFAAGAIETWMKLAFVGGVILTVAVRTLINKKSAEIQLKFYSDVTPINLMLSKHSEYVDDYTSGMDIRLYGMESLMADFASDMFGRVCSEEKKMSFRAAGLNLVAQVMNYALKFGVYMILISAALSGGLTVGSIAKYVSCVMLMMTAISGLVTAAQLSAVNHDYSKRYFSYFDIPNDMYKGTLSVEKRDDNEYYVEFRDVSFRYPNTEAYALRHVSLRCRVGEKLAVVGMNGSGKTTFIKLLCRLYDPTEGEILLNGVDIRKYDYDEYMSIFSVVFQDFRLFAFPLGQNVATGAEYDSDRVRDCLAKAGFGERLDSLPDDLDTPLYKEYSKDGVEISGGEAQKIALARALYKNAPFIVLDEPTAALDPVSEYEVYSNFNRISGGKTAIYISHRLASCRFCDEILVFDGGSVVQHGTHEALLAESGGKYVELWVAQAQYYKE